MGIKIESEVKKSIQFILGEPFGWNASAFWEEPIFWRHCDRFTTDGTLKSFNWLREKAKTFPEEERETNSADPMDAFKHLQ